MTMNKNMHTNNKVYLAGPDVFEKNAIELGKTYVESAAKRGLVGLYPLDNTISPTHPKPDYEIYRLNKELIDSCDYVVANLNDFRGHEPDSGTVWEIAYAFAKGKTVVGYIDSNATILERIQSKEKVTKEGADYFDKDGKNIENFGHSLNIMLQYSIHKVVYGTIEEALNEVEKMMVK